MGSIEEREITLLSSIRIFIDERIRNVRKISQLNGRSRDDHRLEKFTHRSDKEIGIDAVDFCRRWQFYWRDSEIPAEHVDLQDFGNPLLPYGTLAVNSLGWVSCRARRNSVDFPRE